MKSNMWKYAAALFMAFAMIPSCSKPDPEVKTPDPIFPETVVNKTVAAGESVEININPNLEWEVSISGEGSGNYFWIDDAGMKTTKIAGKEAGSVTITVVFSEDEEFDVNRVCDINLKMAGQSKKIATITRPSLGRTFELFTAIAGESDFTQEYGKEAVNEASLVTFAGITEYSLPVRVVTNYDWNIALPSWLKALTADGKTEINAGTAGTTEFILTAVLTDAELNGAKAAVKFIDKNNSSAVNEFTVTLPEFASRVESEINSLNFNIPGQVLMPNGSYADGTAVAYVLAAKGVVVRALEWKGEYHDTKYADWVNIQFGEYDDKLGPLQYIDVLIGVSENPDVERYADLFVFPVSMADVKAEDICNANDPSCGIKEEYAKYHLGRLTQAGQVPPYITPISSEELRAEVGTYFSTMDPKAEDNILQWDFPTAPIYYKITYTGQWSADEGSFECSKPYASVKLFMDTDYPVGMFSKEVTADDNCWISFAGFAENMKGRFNMNFVPESPTHTAAVFYDEAGKILSAVLVEYNPESTGEEDNNIPFEIKTGVGSVARMDTNADLYMAISGNYNVADVYQIITNDKTLYVESSIEFWNALALETTTFANYAGPIAFEAASPNFYLYTSKCTEKSEVIYILQVPGADGVSMVNHSAIHVIYDPAAEIEVEAPFSFVYPDLVGNMAVLEEYSGEYKDAIVAEWGQAQAPKVFYKLTYKDPSAASIAVLNVPTAPQDNAAWNNYPYKADYWLQCEMQGTQMTVTMSEVGKVDHFLFFDATGMPAYVLICTMELAQ